MLSLFQHGFYIHDGTIVTVGYFIAVKKIPEQSNLKKGLICSLRGSPLRQGAWDTRNRGILLHCFFSEKTESLECCYSSSCLLFMHLGAQPMKWYYSHSGYVFSSLQFKFTLDYSVNLSQSVLHETQS